ncbi:hypothetical protein AVT69_gp266 [Pseudomonas phage PhiPA3]|uniref:Uncharacterized protein 268 n=1 Tax=Pseudomonas phage PhiPA3 TaxID=998086 RepID=F8SJA6_BPPA3|nr:hypothetical protein AVT69_gp266 [Pseudomonas phage PhiPA3]AEH03691.1 hypothetical protein [Pseudomonas phage PhiPA3]
MSFFKTLKDIFFPATFSEREELSRAEIRAQHIAAEAAAQQVSVDDRTRREKAALEALNGDLPVEVCYGDDIIGVFTKDGYFGAYDRNTWKEVARVKGLKEVPFQVRDVFMTRISVVKKDTTHTRQRPSELEDGWKRIVSAFDHLGVKVEVGKRKDDIHWIHRSWEHLSAREHYSFIPQGAGVPCRRNGLWFVTGYDTASKELTVVRLEDGVIVDKRTPAAWVFQELEFQKDELADTLIWFDNPIKKLNGSMATYLISHHDVRVSLYPIVDTQLNKRAAFSYWRNQGLMRYRFDYDVIINFNNLGIIPGVDISVMKAEELIAMIKHYIPATGNWIANGEVCLERVKVSIDGEVFDGDLSEALKSKDVVLDIDLDHAELTEEQQQVIDHLRREEFDKQAVTYTYRGKVLE